MSSRRRYGRPGRPKEMLTMGAWSSKSKVLSLWNPIPSKVARCWDSGKCAWYIVVQDRSEQWITMALWMATHQANAVQSKDLDQSTIPQKITPSETRAYWLTGGRYGALTIILSPFFPLRRPYWIRNHSARPFKTTYKEKQKRTKASAQCWNIPDTFIAISIVQHNSMIKVEARALADSSAEFPDGWRHWQNAIALLILMERVLGCVGPCWAWKMLGSVREREKEAHFSSSIHPYNTSGKEDSSTS